MDNIPTNSSELCETSAMNTSGFKFLFSLEIILGLVIIPAHLLFLVVIGRVGSFHVNLRFLLAYHSFNLLFFATANTVKVIRTAAAASKLCCVITSLYDCRVQELVLIVPALNSIYTLVLIVLERLYATIRHKTYDQPKNPNRKQRPFLAMALVTGLLVLISCILAIVYQNTASKQDHMVTCDSYLNLDPIEAICISVPNMIIELIGLGLSIFVYYYNRHIQEAMAINRTDHSLTSRFQIDQNVQFNRVLLPSLVLHVCCFLPNYLLLLFLGRMDMDSTGKTYLVHIMHAVKLIYGVAYPVLMFTKNMHVHQHVIKAVMPPEFIQKRFHKAKVAPLDAARLGQSGRAGAHFEILEKAWEAGAAKRKNGDAAKMGRRETAFAVKPVEQSEGQVIGS